MAQHKNTTAADTQSLELTEDEKKVLLKACTAYKNTIPSYLQSNQDALRLVASVIRKLS